MQPYGGFDHNAQALKIVTSLERSYAEFDGLNLTWETLEGIAKHNGPVDDPLPYALAEYNAKHDLELNTHACAEAQVAALADDIAYNNHDLHDGLRAGSLQMMRWPRCPWSGPVLRRWTKNTPNWTCAAAETRRCAVFLVSWSRMSCV